MNVNSTKRIYIPFGFRGTVIGKTDDRVLVLFDEEFLHGNTMNGYCRHYKGSQMVPDNLINLTKKFESIAKSKKPEVVSKFLQSSNNQVEEVKERTVTTDS